MIIVSTIYLSCNRSHTGRNAYWIFDLIAYGNNNNNNNNNNRNNDTHDNVYGAVIMSEPLWEFTQFIWWM